MSLQLPRFQSKKNSLELEREHFEKGQATSLSKAINTAETAVKEKHVRSAIIGTYQERGASTFWDCVHRLPTKEHPVLCWKFCFVLHKVLREGHEHVLKDSQRYKPMLRELGKFWGHLKSGFGTLIRDYTNLMEIKLMFHLRNPRIPGNLEMEYSELVASVGDNEDAFFQLSVEMLDYLDAILELQADIFKTMDASKCNSMTHAGQCRLTPLIPCIQDSMILYDYTTKILFHLHSKLSSDLLEGHRQRFLKVFRELSLLYERTMSLQYFKNLIDIQLLPKNPPNFLIQSDIENYKTHKVTVYDSGDSIDGAGDTVSDIIDLSELSLNNSNGSNSNSPDPLAERDKIIAELREEISRLHERLRQLQEMATKRIQDLRETIESLRGQLEDKNGTIMEKERMIAQLSAHECKIPNDIAEKMEISEKKNASLDEKFTKMKNLYSNLREDHIDLLRKKGASDKELVELRKVVDGQSEMSHLVENLRKEKEEVESNLFKKLTKKDAQVEELDTELTELKFKIEALESEKEKLESELKSELQVTKSTLQNLSGDKSCLEDLNKSLKSELERVGSKVAELERALSGSKGASDQLAVQIADLQTQMKDNQRNMEAEATQRYNDLLNVCLSQCEEIMKRTIEDLENPLLTGGSGALDHFLLQCRLSGDVVGALESSTRGGYKEYRQLREIVQALPPFNHHMVNLLLHGSATSRTSADIQKGDELLGDCRKVGSSILSLLASIRNRASELNGGYDEIRAKLASLLATAGSLGSSLTPESDAADALEKELAAMEAAIDEAAKKMEEMLSQSRASHSGVKLEVNEKLIDSCTTLMAAIRLLVTRAKGLQKEIVAQGKGTASVKEFYKRNHQWTEGLISAAKAVGGGAKFLLESADKAVSNPGDGFNLLIASSQDIAANTIQLVVASQVRADRSSQNLALLKQASTGVKTATAGVVATAKDCTQLIEESDEVDLAKLSTHNAKRLELETQAEVLKLQTDLEKARMKLAALRQHHYHNAD